MNDVPEGAQRSEDGNYWWDGGQWQPVGGAGASATATGGEDEDVEVRVEATLEEEPVDLTMDELLAEGFSPEEAAIA